MPVAGAYSDFEKKPACATACNAVQTWGPGVDTLDSVQNLRPITLGQ